MNIKEIKGTYIKSYIGDYTKSYKNAYLEHKERLIRQKEYDRVSKKIGSTSYNKGVDTSRRITPEWRGSVNAAGPKGEVSYKKGEILPEGIKDIKSPKPRPKTQPINRQEKRTTIEPPAYKEREKQETKEPRLDEFSQIDANSSKPPITLVGDSQYKDIYTDKMIDEDEARKKLKQAGYISQEQQSGSVMVVIIVLGLIIPFLGPVMLYTMGTGQKSKKTTTHIKTNALGGQTKFSLPATKDELALNKNRGNVFMMCAVISGLFQYYIYLT